MRSLIYIYDRPQLEFLKVATREGRRSTLTNGSVLETIPKWLRQLEPLAHGLAEPAASPVTSPSTTVGISSTLSSRIRIQIPPCD